MSIEPQPLGDLRPLADWIVDTTGRPLRAFVRPTLVLLCGDHGIAERDISAYAAGHGARRCRGIREGSEAVNRLADTRGAMIVAVDVSLNGVSDGGTASFASSEPIDVADACLPEVARDALLLGERHADAAIEAGADILLLGDLGRGSTTVAATLVSVLLDIEPVKCIGDRVGQDELWMRKVSAVRDARLRAFAHRHSAPELLHVTGGPDFAAAVGFLLRASARRVPVLLDGVVGVAAALLARQMHPEAATAWQVARRSDEPAHTLAAIKMGKHPILDLSLPFGEGVGALLALAVVQGAATLGEH